MHKIRRQILLKAMKLFEILAMVVCLLFSMHVFSYDIKILSFNLIWQAEIKAIEVVFFACTIYLWQTIFSIFNLYDSKRFANISTEILDVLKATMIGAALILMTAKLLKINGLTSQSISPYYVLRLVMLLSSVVVKRRYILIRY